MRSFYEEKIKIPNPDTMNPNKENNVNKDIVDFLYSISENSAALYLQQKLSPVDVYSKTSEKIEKERNEEITKISMINSGILETMEKIEKSLRKGQDTSVPDIEKKSALQQVREIHTVQQVEPSSSWFSNLLSSLLGAGMLSFLMGFKNLGPVQFAMKLVEMGWGAIKDKLKSLITGIARGIMAPLSSLIDWILDKLGKIPGFEEFGEKRKKMKAEKEKAKGDSSDKAKGTKSKPADTSKMTDTIKKETEEKLAKQAGKSTAKGIVKKIPFLGLIGAGAFAIDRLLEGDVVGAGMELTSGVLGTLGAVTFGAGTAGSVAVDVALAARDIDRMNDLIITKLDDDGIIDKSWFGDTTVEDWDKIKNLSAEELKALIEHEDLDGTDRIRVQGILYKKQLEQVKTPSDITEFNDTGTKIIFNERELLADNLLESNDKLQEFLLNNPFTDENSIRTENEIDGEKVVEIKYIDADLNDEYVKLKMKYDEDFAKYKESREAQLTKLGDAYDIEGNLYSESEFDKFKESGLTPSQYNEKVNLESARKDIVNAYSVDLSSINLPTGELVERIKKHEGLRLEVYKDTEGYDTIGYGHKLKPGEDYLRAGITKEQAEALFAKDFEYHYSAAKRIPSFDSHPKPIQDALVDMTYNMGPGWHKTWPGTMNLLEKKDYKGVANSIITSKYARQVKGRAMVNAKVFDSLSDTKLASVDVNTPNTNITADVSNIPKSNINNLGKGNAIEAKQNQVQNVEATNKSLVNNTTANSGVYVNNPSKTNNSQTASINNTEDVPLASIFNTYS
jgi:lysozyme